MTLRCATRALKNARLIQSVAPNLIPAKEPPAGFSSLVPLNILDRFHLMSEAELKTNPALLDAATALRAAGAFPVVRSASFNPLFRGTVHFVRITWFMEANGAQIAVNIGDINTAIQFATLAAKSISGYAAQYGPNQLDVSPTMLTAGFAATAAFYNDDALQGWVNTILHDNHLDPGSSCIVVLNPPEMLNTDADPSQGFGGYHSKADAPYCFVNVFGSNFTVKDLPDPKISDHYALNLSHELAEMTVDPDASSNPEVCDPCGPNCGRVWRAYFNVAPGSPVGTLIQTTQAHPPAFDYTYFINAMVQPPHASDCPAAQTACAYAPPGPTTGEPRVVLYDRAAGLGDVYGFDTAGKVNFDTSNAGWRTSWDVIVRGNFIGNGQNQILLYDRSAGQADVVGFDGGGHANLDTTNSGWRTSWNTIVAGNFLGNGRSQILLYDRAAGQADVVGFDNNGKANLDNTTSGWRGSWDLIVVGNFLGNGRSQALLYDRGGGAAAMIGFDGTGKINLDPTTEGWRTSWDLIVVGDFVGNGRDQVLLYDRAAGQADVVGFGANGKPNLDTTNSGWRTSWNLITAGSFVGNGRSQIVLYDRAAGHADVVGFNNVGKEVNLDTGNDGWLTGWDVMVGGNFIGNGRDQILLYDHAAAQADVVGFDSTGKANLDTVNTGLRSSWTNVIVL
jgi:hypothetical protein